MSKIFQKNFMINVMSSSFPLSTFFTYVEIYLHVFFSQFDAQGLVLYVSTFFKTRKGIDKEVDKNGNISLD